MSRSRLNPAFGSGATKSAVDAVTLDSLLRTMDVKGGSDCFDCVPTTGVSHTLCILSQLTLWTQRKFSETFFEKQGPRIEGGWTLIRVRSPRLPPSIDVLTPRTGPRLW